jgi:hypothetical protein
VPVRHEARATDKADIDKRSGDVDTNHLTYYRGEEQATFESKRRRTRDPVPKVDLMQQSRGTVYLSEEDEALVWLLGLWILTVL